MVRSARIHGVKLQTYQIIIFIFHHGMHHPLRNQIVAQNFILELRTKKKKNHCENRTNALFLTNRTECNTSDDKNNDEDEEKNWQFINSVEPNIT